MIQRLLAKYKEVSIIAKATVWFVFCNTLQKCISLITTPIFTRVMSTEQYGQFSIYNSWIQIFAIITTLRLNYAVFNKGMSKYKEKRDEYTSTMQSLTLMLTVLIFAIYLLFHDWINALVELPTFIMIAMFGELLFSPAIEFWSLRKRYEYCYKQVVQVTLGLAIVNAIVGIIAVVAAEEKGYARIISCVVVNMCFGSILFIRNLKNGKKFLNIECAKFAVGFNLPLLIHYFSMYILEQFDRIMIQKLIDIASAGIYSVGYSAGILLKVITQSVNSALVPWEYERLEKGRFRNLDDTLFIIYICIAIFTVIFSSLAPELIYILADRQYYEAIYIVPPVALSVFFVFEYTTLANIEFYYNKNKFTMFVSSVGAILNILLNYIGIKRYGYIAAAYTTLMCYMLFAISHYFYIVYKVGNIIKGKRLLVLNIVTLLINIIVSCLYDKYVMRYFSIGILLLMLIKNRAYIKEIIQIVKKEE